MSKDKFFIIGMGALAASWIVGVLAGSYADSLLIAAGLAFGAPTAIALVAAGPVSRAWWSANRKEAAQPDFRNEAKSSLKFVALGLLPLAAIMGAYALKDENVYWAAFAGCLVALSAFGALRLRDLSARNSL